LRVCLSILFFLVAGNSLSISGESSPPPPKREVRAVWITTASGLDWPRTTDKEEQQSSLRDIVHELKAAHFNTIFFQARARGDAYYRSSYEPWAENLTGTIGKYPGWDPLTFLLAEAHAAGMEAHAWFNVFKIRGPIPVEMSLPQHPTIAHPQWVVQVEGESWFDPGLPDVRTYLLRVALEIVKLYEIDGIHFDFVRYPGRTFPDDESYRRYGRGRNRDEWRRANIDTFITDFYDAAVALKPMLKVGSAPIGVYNGLSDGNGSGSYSRYFQDSQGWLQKRKHDYLVPQVYWDIGVSQGDPDFALLVRKWQQGTAGRHIYIGIGAYKPGVAREIPTQIDTVRTNGLGGEAFFRYENIKQFGLLDNRYRTLANIPPMSWKDSIPPLEPTNLIVSEITPSVFRLDWKPPGPAPDGDRARYYNIYRSPSPGINTDDPETIVAITASDVSSFVDTITSPGPPVYYYAVSAFDKGNNESPPTQVTGGTVREMFALSGKLSNTTSLSISVAHGEGLPVLVGFRLSERVFVSLDLLEKKNDASESLSATLMSGPRDGGTYVVGIPRERCTPGRYVIRLTAEDTALEEPVDLR